MSMARLLLRGMIVGLAAALLSFAFAHTYGEPNVDRAIAVESAIAKAKGEAPEPELVSREVQSTLGLLTGLTVVGTALGGIFALVFALGYGRFSTMRPRAFAALLALFGFVAVYLVPDLKYPSNPPAIGEPATIGMRTGLYFSMVAISIIATLASLSLRRLATARLDGWNATLLGALAFIVMIAIAYYALPVIDEVPDAFPAQTLWAFRLDSLAIQVVLWGGIGLAFGALTERDAARLSSGRTVASTRKRPST